MEDTKHCGLDADTRLLRFALAPYAAGALLCSCSSAPSGAARAVHPSSWTSHTFDGLTISTPTDWTVFRHEPVCPGMASAGAVLLGVSAGAGWPVASGTHNLDVISPNAVSITNFQGTSSLAEGYQTKVVNGFQVRALNEHSKTSIAWWIPSRGLLISGFLAPGRCRARCCIPCVGHKPRRMWVQALQMGLALDLGLWPRSGGLQVDPTGDPDRASVPARRPSVNRLK
jgi:hypothetical protein